MDNDTYDTAAWEYITTITATLRQGEDATALLDQAAVLMCAWEDWCRAHRYQLVTGPAGQKLSGVEYLYEGAEQELRHLGRIHYDRANGRWPVREDGSPSPWRLDYERPDYRYECDALAMSEP